MTPPAQPPAPGTTRARLIEAGLHLFGRNGFEGCSTRALAERAETNVASIAYHFGGKDGLRRACAEHLAQLIGGVFDHPEAPLPATPEAARQEIAAMIRGLTALLLTAPESDDFAPFLIREITDQSEIADLLFERLLLPRHEHLCRLWSVASGQRADSDTVKLTVFSLIGQIVYFRIAKPLVARRMGWPALGSEEAAQIADTITESLCATLERTRI